MSKPNLPPVPKRIYAMSGIWSHAELEQAIQAYAEEAVRQALAAQAKSLRDFADRKYCQAVEYGRRNEALGWESKAKSGRFGADEYACHKKMNEAFGAHFGIYEALKQVVLIPEKGHG